MDPLSPTGFIASVLIGLVAGVVGGLAGIGGSIIMLPALALFFGYQTPDKAEHHLYMASAMCVNAVVAFFSARKHAQVGAVHKPTVLVLLPAMCLAIVVGVLVSDRFDGRIPKLGLVLFLLGFCLYTLLTVRHKPKAIPEGEVELPRARLRSIAGVTGLAAGFLGIGGGIVMVPLLQVVGKVPLRRAIAASASVMWVSAIIGASLKLYTLHSHEQSWLDALALASLMALGAVGGARLGATLTHKLRLPYLKLTIAIILGVAAIRMGLNSLNDFQAPEPSAESVTTPIREASPPGSPANGEESPGPEGG
ncbi:MAG: putative membrane protein YfcA [Phycisphaerales bacterium]